MKFLALVMSNFANKYTLFLASGFLCFIKIKIKKNKMGENNYFFLNCFLSIDSNSTFKNTFILFGVFRYLAFKKELLFYKTAITLRQFHEKIFCNSYFKENANTDLIHFDFFFNLKIGKKKFKKFWCKNPNEFEKR